MKANSKVFKGIEYVQLNQLPDEQQLKIKETLNRNLLIKILMDGKVVGNCVLFKDYEFWYESIFNPTAVNSSVPIAKNDAIKTTLAVDQL